MLPSRGLYLLFSQRRGDKALSFWLQAINLSVEIVILAMNSPCRFLFVFNFTK